MSKRGQGKNRVCFPCRKKYPSKFTDDSKRFNVTSVCSECGSELTSIPDSIRIPKTHQVSRWRALEKQYSTKSLVTPAGRNNQVLRHWNMYPEHMRLDSKLHKKEVRHEIQSDFYTLLKNKNEFVVATLKQLSSGSVVENLIEEITDGMDRRSAWRTKDELYLINRYFQWFGRDCEKILNPKVK